MKTILWGGFLCWTAFELTPLLASGSDPSGWVETFSRAGAVGIMGTLIGYLLVKHIPSIEKRHEDERDIWRTERDEWRGLIKERDDKVVEVLAELRVQGHAVMEHLKDDR